MSSTPTIVEPDSFGAHFKPMSYNSPRSGSRGQGYEPPVFGQPAIGRPSVGPQERSTPNLNANGISNGIYNGDQFGRKLSIDQQSVADSVNTLDLGYHNIGQQPRPQHEISGHQPFDQRSLSTLSLDQQSVGTQSLGHHSIGRPPGGYAP